MSVRNFGQTEVNCGYIETFRLAEEADPAYPETYEAFEKKLCTHCDTCDMYLSRSSYTKKIHVNFSPILF